MLGLVVIDMQEWMFRYPERMEQVPALTANIATLAEAFGSAHLPIFEVQTIHKADRSTWTRLMHKYDYSCLIEGTSDAEPVEGFVPHPDAIRVTKTVNSAFVGTDFEGRLREAGVRELVLTGVFIDGCVGLTAADAAQRGFDVTFVEDATGHNRAERRSMIFDWLATDYELNTRSTQEMIKQVVKRDL